MKKLCIALMLMLPAAACLPEGGNGTITPRTHSEETLPTTTSTTLPPPHECIMLAPGSDNDPDGITYENWSKNFDIDYQPQPGYGIWFDRFSGTVQGYSLAEDSPIWDTLQCAQGHPTYGLN